MRTYGMVPIALFALLRMGEAYAEAEPAEITIYLRGEHKGVVAALLEAVDEGTPVTGIAELDSLAATYGLIGIYRTGRISPFYYGYRFRLTFPPGADVAAMAGAYGNASYIQSVEPEPLSEARAQKLVPPTPTLGNSLNTRAITRIPKKVGVGALTTVGTALIAYGTLKPNENENDFGDPPGLEGAASLWWGLLVGYPVGVYLADPVESSFWMACVGHGLGVLLVSERDLGSLEWGIFLGAPLIASELSRLLPKRYRNPNPFKWLFGKFRRPSPRVSFGLVPTPLRGLSAVAKLRF